MIPRVDAKLENLYAVLNKYGYANTATRYHGVVNAYVADGWASIDLELVYVHGETPNEDPWELRRWGLDKVKECLAELQEHGWYLHSHLDIDQHSAIDPATWTLHGDCVAVPTEWGMSTKAHFEVIGFPPKVKR